MLQAKLMKKDYVIEDLQNNTLRVTIEMPVTFLEKNRFNLKKNKNDILQRAENKETEQGKF
jgi:hypothetical protein